MQSVWRRSPRMGLLSLAVVALAIHPLEGQTPTTGALTGRIVDEAGTPLIEGLVSIREAASGVAHEVVTSRQGEYSFRFLVPGEYELRVEQIGYAPKRVTEIPVRPGRTLSLTTALQAVAPDVGPRIERFPGAVQSGAYAGASQWLPSYAARLLPGEGRELGDLLRLASVMDDHGNVEGLPATLSTMVLDGTTFRPAVLPGVRRAGTGRAAFALSGVESARLVTNGVDAEWGGAAASFLSAHSRRGAAGMAVEGAALWSGDALGASGVPGSESLSHNDVQGGVVFRGPLSEGDRFSFGIEASRLETPLSPAWGDTEAVTDLIAADTYDLGLSGYREAAVQRRDAVAAFARADWTLAARHRIELSGHFSSQPNNARADGTYVDMPAHDAMDAVAGVVLRSNINPDFDNELRVGLTNSTRERHGTSTVSHTRLVAEALAFGAEAPASSARESIIRVSDAVHLRLGGHALEIGAGAELGSYRYERPDPEEGTYLFGDIDQFNGRTGVFARTEGTAPVADWTQTTVSVFAQNRWSAASGVDLLLGVRVDRESLPTSNVRHDSEWFRLTGLANDESQDAALRVSPRVAVTWDINRSHDWTLEAAGGVYHDRVDPVLLAQWQADPGTASVTRAVGAVSWPPDGSEAGVTAPRLTMLESGFNAPRTERLSAGLTHRLGNTLLHVSGMVRRTENLPRRSDLNLLPLPAARDQYGRAVYGVLEQQGGLLAATPGTGRRFSTYDEVALISDDGSSDYWGVTVGVERDLSAGLGLVARYTYGRTTDNWFGAASAPWGHAGPTGLAGEDEWTNGTSDFDVPHRAAAGIVFQAPFGLRLGGVYRFQSGRPFTPGFRAGVDADAAGSADDPAFVDPELPGMTELFSEWSCLGESADGFAARNSCRGPSVHALDLSAALTLLRFGGASTSLVIDAFNVLESGHEIPDAALYLIDPAGSLTVDATARTVTVPLLVNPDFGTPLVRRHSGRRIRLGLSLDW